MAALLLEGLSQVMGRRESLSEGPAAAAGDARGGSALGPGRPAARPRRSVPGCAGAVEARGWLRSRRGALLLPVGPQATVPLGRRSGAVPGSVGRCTAQSPTVASSSAVVSGVCGPNLLLFYQIFKKQHALRSVGSVTVVLGFLWGCIFYF